MGVVTLRIKHPTLSNFRQNEDGAIAVVVALLLVVLLGFTALGVDVASLYRDRAKLQSVSDLTAVSAMAAHNIATERATHAVTRNDMTAGALQSVQTGRFLRNPAIPPENRFQELPANSESINAVRVVLQKDAPLHFARVFSEEAFVPISRPALATRTEGASFSLSSHILKMSGVDLNNLLTQNFNITANIDLAGQNVLADTTINIGTLLEALAAQTGGATPNPAEILNTTTTVVALVEALQSQLPTGAANDLNGLRSVAGNATFDISSLIGGIDTELGLTATDFLSRTEISALDVVRAIVSSQDAGTDLLLDTNINVPGVISAEVALTAGEPPVDSGWIAMGEEGVSLHRAAVRLKTELNVLSDPFNQDAGLLGLGVQIASVNLPLYTEVAGATATLEEISCDMSSPSNVAARFSTSPTPLHPANGASVAALYLGTLPETSGPIDPADLDYADLIDVNIVIPSLLPLVPDITISGVTIQAKSYVTVGASQTDTVAFTHEELANGDNVKTFGSGEILTSAVSTLLSSGDPDFLRVKPGQGGLLAGLGEGVIDSLLPLLPDLLLANLSAPVDSVLDSALSGLGIEAGAGELTLTEHLCEPIRLVR